MAIEKPNKSSVYFAFSNLKRIAYICCPLGLLLIIGGLVPSVLYCLGVFSGLIPQIIVVVGFVVFILGVVLMVSAFLVSVKKFITSLRCFYSYLGESITDEDEIENFVDEGIQDIINKVNSCKIKAEELLKKKEDYNTGVTWEQVADLPAVQDSLVSLTEQVFADKEKELDDLDKKQVILDKNIPVLTKLIQEFPEKKGP